MLSVHIKINLMIFYMKSCLFVSAMLLSVGCAAQQHVQARSDTAAAEVLTHAVEAGHYRIDIDKIHSPEGKSLDVNDSYFCTTQTGAVLQLSPEVFRERPFRKLGDLRNDYKVLDRSAPAIRKNGDLQFTVSIANETNPKATYKLLVTVYTGSDRCSVRMTHERGQTCLCEFRGRISAR